MAGNGDSTGLFFGPELAMDFLCLDELPPVSLDEFYDLPYVQDEASDSLDSSWIYLLMRFLTR